MPRRPDKAVAASTQNCDPGKLKHPVLGTREFEDFRGSGLTALQRKGLNAEPSYTDLDECNYIYITHPFKKAEVSAARVFCNGLIGRSETTVLEAVGSPSIRTKSLVFLGDPPQGRVNWIYLLGYDKVAVKAAFEEERCVEARVLSDVDYLQLDGYITGPIHSARRSDVPGMPLGCKPFPFSDISRIFAEPDSAEVDSDGNGTYEYSLNHTDRLVVEVKNHQCVKINGLVQFGFKTKGE